jgi:hypothetical protein
VIAALADRDANGSGSWPPSASAGWSPNLAPDGNRTETGR